MNEDNKKNSELVDQVMRQIQGVPKEQPVKKALKLPQSPLIKPKHYYDVKIECMLPATLTYRVLAEDPQEAALLVKGLSPTGVKHRLHGRKELKLSVYDAGSSMLRWMKNLLVG
jgi:hypothetical protein